MSTAVLVIAALHAIPPIAGAFIGKSKTAVFIGTGIACVIAVAKGGSAYTAIDLIGAGLGTWIGVSVVNSEQKNDK